MDALALLCTLHADGPQTLKRLRNSGCDSLQALESFEPAALARTLDVAPAVARRLAREARLLAQRVDVDLDREEAPTFETHVSEPVEVAVPAAAATADHLERRDRELLGKVMERWREEDSSVVEDDTVLLESESRSDDDEFTTTEETLLGVGELDGLRDADVAQLAGAGITTLEELVGADSFELVQASGLPFANVKRFQLLAQRALDETDGEIVQEAREQSFSPADDDVLVAEALEHEDSGTVLDWNFEIPPPPSSAPAGYDDPSGPFA